MKELKIVCLLLAFLFIYIPQAYPIEEDETELFYPVNIVDGSVLSISDCVALAFKNSPKIKREKYNLDIAKSNVGIARAQFFPTLNAGIGFNYERNSNGIYYDKKYRDLPAVGVTANQLIWDFGKTTAYIKMEEFYNIAAEYEFMDSLCYTLFDIKAKYYNYLRTKALFEISKKNMEINEQFVKLSQNNDSSEDLTTAEVYLSEARIKYLEYLNNRNNAKFDLSNSMYLEFQPDYDIKDTPTFTYNLNENSFNTEFKPYNFPFTQEEAVEIAYENSPDLQVLKNTKKAMEQSLKYVKRTYLPELNAGVGYGFNKTYSANNNSLQVGVNLSSGINIMELKHNISGAEAQLNIADNEINLFKKDLYYEVQRAFNNVKRSQNQVPTAKKEVEQAVKNFEIVKNKYIEDKLNYIALQEARKNYIQALENYVEKIYNYNISLIQVEMAMHYHLIDIHHKSEHAIHYHAAELIEHLNKVLECDETEINNKIKKKPK